MEATVQTMLEEMRKQETHTPDPAAWEGISLVDSNEIAEQWLALFADEKEI